MLLTYFTDDQEWISMRMIPAALRNRRLRDEIPDLVIENRSSGGRRPEPSLMAVSDALFRMPGPYNR